MPAPEADRPAKTRRRTRSATPGETPARRVGREQDGLLLLGDSHIRWGHGGEAATATALREAADLSDMSDELAELGGGWPAVCDCGRERGHLVRALSLHDGLRVLEVGAGCGGVTRTLAERCGLVDALEPNPDRARLAAERLRDVPTARVLVGEVDDLPVEPAYDLIVLVGVLEYVGGWEGGEPRTAFLHQLARLLLPGGHIACAIENRFGISYFAGQAEDHSGWLFQGVEGHPRPHPARTFARPELERIFEDAGLRPTTLGVFPDYRFPRMVFAPSLLTSAARPLAWRVPGFPAPRHPSFPPASILDEERVWRGFVENGMGAEFPNSFLVVAGVGEEQALWPEDLLAAYYSTGRRRRYATESRVVRAEDGVVVERRGLGVEEPEEPSALVRHYGNEAYREGRELTEVLMTAPADEVADWLVRYAELVEQEVAKADGAPFDLWPGNLIVSEDRQLLVVDTELSHTSLTSSEIVRRGILMTAFHLAGRALPDRWNARTVRGLVQELAQQAGLDVPLELEGVLHLQAELVTEIFCARRDDERWQPCYDDVLADLRARLDMPLTAFSVNASRDAGPQMAARLAHVTSERDYERRHAAHLARALDETRAEAGRAQAQADEAARSLAAIRRSVRWQAMRRLRRRLRR